jgi:hypothetical protein
MTIHPLAGRLAPDRLVEQQGTMRKPIRRVYLVRHGEMVVRRSHEHQADGRNLEAS